MQKRKNRKVRKKSNTDIVFSVAACLFLIIYLNPVSLELLIIAFVFLSVIFISYKIVSKKKRNTNLDDNINNHPEIQEELKACFPVKKTTDTFNYYKENNNIKKTEVIEKWSIDLIKSLEWKRYEELCAGFYEEKGFIARATQLGADGGIDIQLFRESFSELKPMGIVQCKAWNTYKVGVKSIRELYGVMAADNITYGVFATSGEFTKDAKDFANGKKVKLIDGNSLLEQILQLPTENQEKLLKKTIQGDYTTVFRHPIIKN